LVGTPIPTSARTGDLAPSLRSHWPRKRRKPKCLLSRASQEKGSQDTAESYALRHPADKNTHADSDYVACAMTNVAPNASLRRDPINSCDVCRAGACLKMSPVQDKLRLGGNHLLLAKRSGSTLPNNWWGARHKAKGGNHLLPRQTEWPNDTQIAMCCGIRRPLQGTYLAQPGARR